MTDGVCRFAGLTRGAEIAGLNGKRCVLLRHDHSTTLLVMV